MSTVTQFTTFEHPLVEGGRKYNPNQLDAARKLLEDRANRFLREQGITGARIAMERNDFGYLATVTYEVSVSEVKFDPDLIGKTE